MDKWEKFWKNEKKSSLPDDFFQMNYQEDNDEEEVPDYIESLTTGAVQRNWRTPTEFPCCPAKISDAPLEDYLKNLQIGKIFCKHQYGQSEIVKFGLAKDKNSIVIQCFDAKNSVKGWYIVKITFENNLFVHTSDTSCFTDDGADKYYILALGEEWTGGDVFDDYC